MSRFVTRAWHYLTVALTGKFEELADPKIQIEQAIDEAEKQHALLTQQAANVIAHQKDTELQLNRALEQVQKFSASSRQALLLADKANEENNFVQVTKYEHAAQIFVQRLIVAEEEAISLKEIYLNATQASEQAKRAVQKNRAMLERKSAEKAELLSQLDQVKMRERMNATMANMNAVVGSGAPTLDEVRRKIERRYAKAIGAATLQAESVETKMLDIEQAAIEMETATRLDNIRQGLGIEPSISSQQSTVSDREISTSSHVADSLGASHQGALPHETSGQHQHDDQHDPTDREAAT